MQIVNSERQVTSMGIPYRFVGSQRKVIDGWMWNKRYTEYTDKSQSLDTVRVDSLLDMAKHYWLDEYIPVKGLTDGILREMESELRQFFKGGVQVPDGQFLELKTLPDIPLTGSKGATGKEVVHMIEVEKRNESGAIVGTTLEKVKMPDLKELMGRYKVEGRDTKVN